MATQLGPTPMTLAQDLFTSGTTQNHVLGEKAYSNDGRTFRYVKVGAAALVPGNVLQSPAVTAAHTNITPTAVSAVGDTTITTSSITTVANEYANGTMVVEKGSTGAGLTYLIKSNPAVSAAACTFVLSDPISVATTGTITVSFIRNPYNGVIQYPITTGTGTPVGVAVTPIAIGGFGWICSRGITGVLADGAQTVGVTGAAVPAGAAGAAKVMAATLFQIGVWSKTTIDTQITPCYLTLD